MYQDLRLLYCSETINLRRTEEQQQQQLNTVLHAQPIYFFQGKSSGNQSISQSVSQAGKQLNWRTSGIYSKQALRSLAKLNLS